MNINLYTFNKLVDEGYLNRSSNGHEVIWVYTPKTEYEKYWTKETRMSRGLVTDEEGNILCKTLSKFYNLEQTPETKLENLDLSQEYLITEKLDGSFISLWWNKRTDTWQCSSKGSLANEYIDYAMSQLPDMSSVSRNKVFACEICMPRNLDGMRRAVDHDPGLYFISAFDSYQNFRELDWHRESKLWPGDKKVKHYPDTHFNALLEKQKKELGTEGWVVKFDSGLRIKIKTRHYLKIFAFINQLNYASIKEFMLNYGVDSNEWLESFPEELLKEAREMKNTISYTFYNKLHDLMFTAKEYNKLTNSRKEFALQVKDLPDSWALFDLYSGKDIKHKLLTKLEF